MKVRIGLGFGQWPFQSRKPKLFFDLISHCDSLGIDSIWFSDRIIGADNILEPTVAMAAVAGRSKFMKLGTNVLIFPLRNPVLMAKELATLDFLSNGRLLLVAGLGRDDEDEFQACGISKKSRGKRTDEVITLLRKLWTEENVNFDGEFYRLNNVNIDPVPIQKYGPPIWIGGRSDAALRRTGRLGDGWLPSYLTPNEAKIGIESIKQYTTQFGRIIPDDHYGVNIQFFIGSTQEEALKLSSPYQALRRTDIAPEEYGAFGTTGQIVERLRQYMKGGVTKFVMKPVCSPDHLFSQLELLANNVLTELQTPFSEMEVKERSGLITP